MSASMSPTVMAEVKLFTVANLGDALPAWLPAGRFTDDGMFVAPGIEDAFPDALKVNVKTGRWSDADRNSDDIIQLRAALTGATYDAAARELQQSYCPHISTWPDREARERKNFDARLENIIAFRPNNTSQTKPQAALWLDEGDWNEADIPLRPWIAHGYLLRGSVTLVAGPPSALKSSVMLGWACALALDLAYGAFKPAAPGRSIVYDVEDDKFEQRRRLSATLRAMSTEHQILTSNDISGKVLRVGPTAIGTLLLRGQPEKGEPLIVFTDAMKRLEELVTTHKPAMVCVDPLAELHDAEENDNTSLRAVIAEFRAFAVKHNTAVVVLHHTRKGSAASAGDPDIARGASAIIGAVRVAVTLTGMSEDDAKEFGLPLDPKSRSKYVRMDDAKSNYAAIRDAVWFEKVPYALANGDNVAAAKPWTPPTAKAASQTDLDMLVAAIQKGCQAAQGMPWSPQSSADARSIRTLLEDHGFVGTQSQMPVINALKTSHGMGRGKFKRPDNRVIATGLRIDGLPAAAWLDDEHEE